jgi:hypothetical protein
MAVSDYRFVEIGLIDEPANRGRWSVVDEWRRISGAIRESGRC